MVDPYEIETVEALRELLVKDFSYTQEEADAIKGKNNLREHIRNLQNPVATSGYAQTYPAEYIGDEEVSEEELDEFLDQVEKFDTNNLPNKRDEDPDLPKPDGSIKWHEFVMGKLLPDEVVESPKGDKMPRLHGLRRLAIELIGNIVDDNVDLVCSPNNENGYTAVAKSTLTFTKNGMLGDAIVSSDIADCTPRNSKHPYSLHLTSMASSRAVARNLRKALKLRNVIAAEEYVEGLSEDDADSHLEPFGVTDAQLDMMDIVGKKCDVDMFAFINKGEQKFMSAKDLDRETANRICNTLNKIRNKETGYETVPEELKGYKEGWR